MKLSTFFKEKDLPLVNWELEDYFGVRHDISNEVVIEFLLFNKDFGEKAARTIFKIDRHNGDVNDFLKHVAGFIINS